MDPLRPRRNSAEHPNAQDDCEGCDVAADRNRRDFCDLFLDHRAHRDSRPYSRDRGHRLVPHLRGPRVGMEWLFLTRSSCRMRRDSCSSHHWALDTDHRSGHASEASVPPQCSSNLVNSSLPFQFTVATELLAQWRGAVLSSRRAHKPDNLHARARRSELAACACLLLVE